MTTMKWYYGTSPPIREWSYCNGGLPPRAGAHRAKLAAVRPYPLGLAMSFASADVAPPAPGYPPFDQAGDDLAALIRRAAEGDRVAFRRIYDHRAGRLYAVALRITRQSALAADALQEAFLQRWQNAGQFDATRGHAEAWLLSLVRYRALDLVRRHGRETLGAEIPETADDAPDPLAALLSSSDGKALHRCLETLEEDRRRLLLRAFVDGLSHQDLATATKQPLGTIKSWIRRALQALKKCLEP
jgi:RNA polymerase sigma-70 factor (ECF subfamily)